MDGADGVSGLGFVHMFPEGVNTTLFPLIRQPGQLSLCPQLPLAFCMACMHSLSADQCILALPSSYDVSNSSPFL